MPDYEKMYLLLFNCITDALRELQQQNLGKAAELLIHAQQATEVLYLTQNEK